ncbi:MAG: hypothetical protein C4K49_03900 [Candidatus Thorarchaeota archaeon]|nr:MAG: hypothetical protein C4K49_03900 [Candidatus Thorarchaeota archaeon]
MGVEVLAATEQHDIVSRLLFIIGALGSIVGVIAPISRYVIYEPEILQTSFYLWLDTILWALWYSLMGLGFLGFHRRYGRTCPSSITLLGLVTAALQILESVLPSVFIAIVDQTAVYPYLIVSSYLPVGTVTTLAMVGYALRQTRERSRNRMLMGITGIGLIVGGIAIAAPFRIVWLIASVSSLLAFLLFIQECRVR